MDNVAPIQIAAFQRMNQGFRRGNVSRYRDIVYVTQAQKLRRIALRLFLRQRIPKNNKRSTSLQAILAAIC